MSSGKTCEICGFQQNTLSSTNSVLMSSNIKTDRQSINDFRTIFRAAGSLGLFRTLSKLTSWFPANLAADGPPKDKMIKKNYRKQH